MALPVLKARLVHKARKDSQVLLVLPVQMALKVLKAQLVLKARKD